MIEARSFRGLCIKCKRVMERDASIRGWRCSKEGSRPHFSFGDDELEMAEMIMRCKAGWEAGQASATRAAPPKKAPITVMVQAEDD